MVTPFTSLFSVVQLWVRGFYLGFFGCFGFFVSFLGLLSPILSHSFLPYSML